MSRNRRTRETETMDYAKMMLRMVRAYSRRVADGDPDDLTDMLAVAAELDAQIALAVQGNRDKHGRSWADIAAGAGITRQAAQQRWGRDRSGVKAAAVTEQAAGSEVA